MNWLSAVIWSWLLIFACGQDDFDDDDTFLSASSTLPPVPDKENCGRISAFLNSQSDWTFNEGAWPWLVVLYLDEGNYFRCSGTLITKRHVVTAARCAFRFTPSYQRVQANQYTAALGVYNTSAYRHDPKVQIIPVSRIVLNPSYTERDFRHDLAVFVLTRPASITSRVKPICAWPANSASLINKITMEAGWSLKNRDYERGPLPRQWSVPVVQKELCYRHELDSEHLCAGNEEGSGACKGDAGAGLFVAEPLGKETRWSLAAVFCYFKTNCKSSCDCVLRGAWTEISRYASWIKSVIDSTEPSTPPTWRPEPNCGHVDLTNNLVHHGRDTRPGDWPWIAALFEGFEEDTSVNYEFLCSGVLVTSRHVITAAHCVQPPTSQWPAKSRLIFVMGMYHIRKIVDSNTQARHIDEIIVHPFWRAEGRKDGDLALLVLVQPVTFTAVIQPVCLWDLTTTLTSHNGTVVGWGADEVGNRVTETPKLAVLPLVTNQECKDSHSRLTSLVTENTFCAGSRNGSGPCNGDSGSGLYLPALDSQGRRYWMVRGVVSRSLKNPETGQCDLTQFVVFTDLAAMKPWLEEKIKRTTPRNRRSSDHP